MVGQFFEFFGGNIHFGVQSTYIVVFRKREYVCVSVARSRVQTTEPIGPNVHQICILSQHMGVINYFKQVLRSIPILVPPSPTNSSISWSDVIDLKINGSSDFLSFVKNRPYDPLW